MPARYGLFIAEFRERMVEGEVMLSPKTAREKVVFPIHKLFPGKDCIEGLEIPGFDYHEQHISDKLKLLFIEQQIKTKFKLNEPPFIRTSENHGLKLNLQNEGFSVLLVPASSTALVEEAKQNNRTVSFLLKPGAEPRQRYATSLQIENTRGPFKDEARIAPEYANIRLISFCATAISAANTAVDAPTHVTTVSAGVLPLAVTNGRITAPALISGYTRATR